MFLETNCTLNYGDDGVIKEGDKIKVSLENGEILIGEYENSDFSSLGLDRNSDSIDIDFKDIKDIEKLESEE